MVVGFDWVASIKVELGAFSWCARGYKVLASRLLVRGDDVRLSVSILILGAYVLSLAGCERARELSDRWTLIRGEITPMEMAECASLFDEIGLMSAQAEMAAVAAIEAGRIMYGWTPEQTQAETARYRHRPVSEGYYRERVSAKCGEYFPLMSRLRERSRAF